MEMDTMDQYDASAIASLAENSGLIINFPPLRISALYLLLVPFVMQETRSSILLTRIARNLRKTTGDHRYRARVEDERANLGTLIFISCTRPVRK